MATLAASSADMTNGLINLTARGKNNAITLSHAHKGVRHKAAVMLITVNELRESERKRRRD